MSNTGSRRPASLRFRLLAATVAGIAVALLLAGLVLGGLFREHVMRQFESAQTQQLDQITARLEFDASGNPALDPLSLSDPRWQRPYSGLYWQIDEIAGDGKGRMGVLRSRSLWDTSLQLEVDTLADGSVHVHDITGPAGSRLLVVERTIRPQGQSSGHWRLAVAADLKPMDAAAAGFNGVLALSLAALLVLLVAAAWAQVAVGLRPLHMLQRSLRDLQAAREQRLNGAFPAEVMPLVEDFNRVLDRSDEVVARARTQAGNLAHALKTPLAVLEQAAARELGTGEAGAAHAGIQGAEFPQLVRDQVQVARRFIDWHLARSRVAATQRQPGQRTPVGPVLSGLVRVMERVHASRNLSFNVVLDDDAACFAGEEQDLQELLGNLLDNSCKWARSAVTVRIAALSGAGASRLQIDMEDDGAGIEPALMEAVMARGVRLDESVTGSGLGLGIVRELVDLYGGELVLGRAAAGGLHVRLVLPAAA